MTSKYAFTGEGVALSKPDEFGTGIKFGKRASR
jgi:hypothetical protein